MTYPTKMTLISVFFVFAVANSAEADCPITSPDSTISFAFYLGDSLANPVARATGDSMWIFVYYPSGGLAFADSVRLLNGSNLAYRQTQIQGRLTGHFSYSRLVSEIDGTAQNGKYEVVLLASDSSLALQSTFLYCFDERLGGLDSIGVDGTQFAAGTGLIDASVIADNAIDAGAIASDAITAEKIATGAITSDEIAQSAGDEIGFYTWNMGDDSAGWTSGADTSMGRHMNWLNPSENFGINWGDVSNPTTSVNLSGTTIATVTNQVVADVALFDGNPVVISGGVPQVHTGSMSNNIITSNILQGSAAKEIADSTWNDWISSNTHDSTFGGAFTIGGAAVRANYDSSYGTIANSQVDDDVKVTLVDSSANDIAMVGNSHATDSANIKAVRDTIVAHAPHANNWGGTAAGGAGTCDNGNGAQTVTIKVADTSGTYAVVVGARVSVILNNTSYWALTNGSGIATLYLDPTSYTAYASMNGYNFTAKSITVPSSSYSDSILGYDVTTSGTVIASSQQVTLYDWALSPGNDTLYGAKVTITLSGSSNFYTSTHLVPAASIVVYAGANDGTSNGGKWQETIFGTDSLFSPGDVSATYSIEIEHPLLDRSGQKIVYRNLTIPASATPTRLRSIVAQQ